MEEPVEKEPVQETPVVVEETPKADVKVAKRVIIEE